MDCQHKQKVNNAISAAADSQLYVIYSICKERRFTSHRIIYACRRIGNRHHKKWEVRTWNTVSIFMPDLKNKIIWTIGHSTRSLEEFIAMLESFEIGLLTDIRSYPGSRRYPHFNKGALEISLPAANISYIHLPELGGRRKVRPDSKNTAWHHPAFRGYADYMETAEFKIGIDRLEILALEKRTAYMCSEAVWWRCHRSLVSDYLKVRGWEVLHIMGIGKSMEHPYTSAARIKEGGLFYTP